MISRRELKYFYSSFANTLISCVKFVFFSRILNTSYRFDSFFTCRAFSHDVTAVISVFQDNETAAMLLFQTNPVNSLLMSKPFFSVGLICIDAGHVR